jgi:hypothetical protein
MKTILLYLLLMMSLTGFSQATYSTLKVTGSFKLASTSWTGIQATSFGADSTNAAKGASIRAITNWANGRLAELYNYINTAETINTDGSVFTDTDGLLKWNKPMFILSGSASLDFPSTAAGTSSALNITVTGATVGDCVALGFGNASITTGQTFSAEVTIANTVTVIFLNASGSAADPAAAVFNVRIIK